MKLKNKYLNIVKFIKVYDQFKNADEEIDVNENSNLYNDIVDLKTYLDEKNITPQKTLEDCLQELVDKYDYDNDGIISIIDVLIISNSILGTLDNDSKYDSIMKTYNGKSLDINEDDTVDVADIRSFNIKVFNKLKNYINVKLDDDINNIKDEIVNYYSNHNYTWPTLEQLDYYKKNGVWE